MYKKAYKSISENIGICIDFNAIFANIEISIDEKSASKKVLYKILVKRYCFDVKRVFRKITE